MKLEQFMSQFKFDPALALYVGVERECFLTNQSGQIKPIAPHVLKVLGDSKKFGYELSACQLEERIGPCEINDVRGNLEINHEHLTHAEQTGKFKRLFTEVGPKDMPFDIYPDPSGRYQMITKQIPQTKLEAACRVIGTHVHIGMPDADTALGVYNRVISKHRYLSEVGNGSFGERLAIYRIMSPASTPKRFPDWSHFHQYTQANGFENDPRRCWAFVRISVHGTIEFRMFGATPCLDRVESWAKLCHDLCASAISKIKPHQ